MESANHTHKLIGPFRQLVTLRELPLKGALSDEQLEVISSAGILIHGDQILEVDHYEHLVGKANDLGAQIVSVAGDHVCLPGFIDAHTHVCFGGTRARDYALRNAGKSYLEIAREGGGIWDTVKQTRQTDEAQLVNEMLQRLKRLTTSGITTVEVKSGYGLSIADELKMLRAIKSANEIADQDLIPTCLAAHVLPRDYDGNHHQYLQELARDLLPQVLEQGLASRADIFIEDEAFGTEMAFEYLQSAQKLGFDLTVHADQFSAGGSQVAADLGAKSADHLEASTEREIKLLAESDVVAMALPGASIGLGCAFTPARKILDHGGSLAIASDWNPGSAPMGELLVQASMLATSEKLTNAEVLAGITNRAAAALGLSDRGILEAGKKADFIIYNTSHYNEVFYHQGMMKPAQVWKDGKKVLGSN